MDVAPRRFSSNSRRPATHTTITLASFKSAAASGVWRLRGWNSRRGGFGVSPARPPDMVSLLYDIGSSAALGRNRCK